VGWKVVVDLALCESNAFCMGIVPEVFELDDDNYLHLLQDNPPDELRELCEQAARTCPRQAISIDDS
jgi:ferredoxin